MKPGELVQVRIYEDHGLFESTIQVLNKYGIGTCTTELPATRILEALSECSGVCLTYDANDKVFEFTDRYY